MKTRLGIAMALAIMVPAQAATPYGFVIRSTVGGSDFRAEGIEEVPISGLKRATFPEPIRATKVYCARNWTGVIGELDGVYYALNGKARGREITVAGISPPTKVEDGNGETGPFRPYDEEPTAMIQVALAHCGHKN